MLTVSLHGICIDAAHGLYAEEKVLGNSFEVDVDIQVATTENEPLPFVDYTLIQRTVHEVFGTPEQLLESLVWQVHSTLKQKVKGASLVKVCVRKMHPPMPGSINYAQVCYEA